VGRRGVFEDAKGPPLNADDGGACSLEIQKDPFDFLSGASASSDRIDRDCPQRAGTFAPSRGFAQGRSKSDLGTDRRGRSIPFFGRSDSDPGRPWGSRDCGTGLRADPVACRRWGWPCEGAG